MAGKFVIRLCFCAIAWILFSPIVVGVSAIVLALLVWRYLIDFLVLIKHPRWTPVSAPDLVFLGLAEFEDKVVVGNIAEIAIVGSEFDKDFEKSVQNLRSSFQANVLDHPSNLFWKLKCVPTQLFGFSYWAPSPTTTDLCTNQIRVVRMQQPTDQDIDKFLSREWITSSFARQPLWEIVVVQGHSTGTIVALRMHHTIGGVTAMRRIFGALSGKPVELDAPSPKPELWANVCQAFQLPATIIFLRNRSGQKDGLPVNDLVSELTYDRAECPVTTVQQIAKHFKCHFRTVLAATLGSALRRCEFDQRKIVNNGGAEVTVTPIVVNLELDGALSGPLNYLNNSVTSCTINYHLNTENPAERLHQTNAQLQEKLELGIHKLNRILTYAAYILPAPVVKNLAKGIEPISNICSNYIMTLAADELKMERYEVKSVYLVTGPSKPRIGCFGAFITNGENIGVAIVNARKMIQQDADATKANLALYFEQELQLLVEIANSDKKLNLV